LQEQRTTTLSNVAFKARSDDSALARRQPRQGTTKRGLVSGELAVVATNARALKQYLVIAATRVRLNSNVTYLLSENCTTVASVVSSKLTVISLKMKISNYRKIARLKVPYLSVAVSTSQNRTTVTSSVVREVAVGEVTVGYKM
jgi:hypothetical protein